MEYRETFERGPKLFPDKIAIVDGHRRFTYRQFGERQNRLANALIGLGLKKGDRLGLLLKNCAEYFEAFGAGAESGIVIGGINYRLNPDSVEKMLVDLDCRALLVHHEFVDIIQAMRNRLPFIKTFISVGCQATDMKAYESLLDSASPEAPHVAIDRDDLAAITYTSGTTGDPKGVVTTRNIAVRRFCNIAIEMSIAPDDIFIAASPLFHVVWVTAAGFLFRADTIVCLKDWDTTEFCRLVQVEKVTKCFLAPVIINFILTLPAVSDYDLSSLRLILYGGAPMPLNVLKKAVKLLPSCLFVQSYGSTECYASIVLRAEEHAAALGGASKSVKRMGSCGRQATLAMAKVVDEAGADVAPGEVGEILLSGGLVMTGYWQKPAETAKTLRNGWCHTNDLATVDEEGYIYVVDRKNHMIITGGENVYPAQVENVLFDHPKVQEAAVIGVPDDTWGEAVKAFIVVKENETLLEDELIDFCRPRMANYAKPKIVEFVRTLPHTATGKVDKCALKRTAQCEILENTNNSQ